MAITVNRGTQNGVSSGLTNGTVPSALVQRDVKNFIQIMRRHDKPMLSLVKSGGSKTQRKWERGEGDLAPVTDILAEDLDTSETGVDVTNGTYFQQYDLIRIPSSGEVMFVTSISGNTLTVTRGWGATSGTAASNGATIQILGPATPEGVDAVASPVAFGQLFNIGAQILEYSWTYTHRAKVTPNYQYPEGDQFKAETKKKMQESADDVDSLFLNGVYNEGDGSSTNPATMGGLRDQTTTNLVNVNGDPLEYQDLKDELQVIHYDVGSDMGLTFMGGQFAKRIWDSWFQPSRRTTVTDDKMKLNWSQVEDDFGTMKFIVNRKCDDNELFLCNPDDWKYYTYGSDGDWKTGLYATQGWYDRGFLHADLGPEFAADRRRARWYGFSTTKSDYPNLDIPA